MLEDKERTNKKNKDGKTRFHRAGVGHRMMDHKGNEDIKEELGIKETRKENNEIITWKN